MIVFAGICKGKTQNRNVLRASKKVLLFFFVAHEARYDFEFSLANASVTRLKHVTNARRTTRKCRFRYHTSLELWKQYDFRARCCWPVKKCHFHGRCIALTTNECHSFAVKHAWDYKRDRRADCSWARLVNPQVKASDVFLFGLYTKMKPETFLVGSEAYKLEVKSITHAFAWSSPNLNPETIC